MSKNRPFFGTGWGPRPGPGRSLDRASVEEKGPKRGQK